MNRIASEKVDFARAALIHSPDLDKYHYPPSCPLDSQRAGKARRIIKEMGLQDGPQRREVAPLPATRDAMETFHDGRYLDILAQAGRGRWSAEGQGMGLGTEDCPVWVGLYDYASLACGASLKAAELILAGEASVAFNPSGGYHHAHRSEAAGFCYINDVAVACMHLARAGKRVLYLDVDAHHGDGVQEAFYDRKDVMTISFHQDGRTLFPGTGFEDEIGIGEGVGYTVNVPLPMGTYDQAYIKAFDAISLPLIGKFDPDVIAMELGMDALAGDPLTQLELTNNTHEHVIRSVMAFAKPILAVGGGGYHVENTVRSWALAWGVMSNHREDSTLDRLRDIPAAPQANLRARVNADLHETIEKVQANVFPHHGL